MDGHNLIRDVGLSIFVAALCAVPAYFVGVPLLLAYLAAGVALGPHLGFGVIHSAESIATLSEIGLVLLMFILGLEIDLRKLLQAGRAVIVNGVTQFLGCFALGLGVFALAGYGVGGGRFELIYLAMAAALSSTLVVVKILSDRVELDTLTSRITLGILVFQDLWAIAFLAVQANLNDLQASVLAIAIGKAIILVCVAAAFARYLLPKLFARISKQPELLLVAAMAWCFGMCGFAGYLGLSREMGALVAGVTIAAYPYHADIAAKISSLRDFFITLFFVALGLQIPRPTVAILGLTALLVGFVLVSRLITVFPVLYGLRYGNRASLLPALNLAQISEFSLVLAALGVSYGHIGTDIMAAFVLTLVVTALISSGVIPRSHDIYRVFNPLLTRIGFKDRIVDDGPAHDTSHGPEIILLGFYRDASSLLEEILRRHPTTGTKHVLVVDYNPESHAKLKARGVSSKYGDLSHPDTLRHLQLEKARVIVSTIPDHLLKGTSNLKLLRALKRIAPEAHIIVTAETMASARDMYREGAAYVCMPRIVTAHFLADLIERMENGRGQQIRDGGEAFVQKREEVLG